MKNKLIFLFFLVFTFSMGEIRDQLNLFPKENIPKLEEAINKFENNNEIRFYLITSQYGEGFVVENPEKTMILNIQKNNENGDFSIESSFSRDLDMEGNEEDLNFLLDNLETFLEKKTSDNVKYVEEYLEGINDIFKKNNIDYDDRSMLQKYKWDLIKWGVILLTLINIISRIRYVSKLKKKRMEDALKLKEERLKERKKRLEEEKKK